MANSHPKGSPASFRPSELHTKHKSTFETTEFLTRKRHQVFNTTANFAKKRVPASQLRQRNLSRFLLTNYSELIPHRSLTQHCNTPRKSQAERARKCTWTAIGLEDTATRRSTSGVTVRRRLHLLRHSSTIPNVIGLSSAGSEFYALTKGGCSRLGLQSLFADWNLKLQLRLLSDSSSAKKVASRRGAGKNTRQKQTKMLWLQERVAAKHFRIVLTEALGR